VIASDVRPRRMALLQETVRQSGARRVRVVQVPASGPLPFSGTFDRVLVDAPCSGLGTIRREPEVRWRRTADDLVRFADQQRRMLSHAAAGVRPGGRLVYATCSSEPEENEAVAAAFLADHPAFRAVSAKPLPLPPAIAPAIDDAGHLRTYPFAHGLEAFFAAVFERLES
jgi:16S rRNA (cytosine967-C5)-methyltransferase